MSGTRLKKILAIVVFFSFLISCGADNPLDCIQAAGDPVTIEIETEAFTKIRTETDVRLVIKQGAAQRVMLKSHENLVGAIEVQVKDGVMTVRNTGTCNFTRDHGLSQLVVTSPNITEIRNASSFEVASDGVLTFPTLTLVSNTAITGVEQINKSGDFILTVNNGELIIRANGKGLFRINGTSQVLDVRFDDESPRLEAKDLIAQEVNIFHRGANKMIVNPRQSLKGIITGTGDVIALNRPPVVEVEERFSGRLIFKE